MKYSIEFTQDQLQFVMNVLRKTPLVWDDVNSIIITISNQAKDQEEAYKNPITKIIEDYKKEESTSD